MAFELAPGSRVLMDTNPLIYLFEDHPFAAQFTSIFEAIDAGRVSAIVTPITIAEITSGPLKAGKAALAERYRNALTTSAGWSLCAIDDDVAMLAARVRIEHKLRLPDAFQLAVALREGCEAIVTHDRDFKDTGVLKVISGA